MPSMGSRGTRLLVAPSGVVGVITSTAHLFIPPERTARHAHLPPLTAYGTGHHDAILVSA